MASQIGTDYAVFQNISADTAFFELRSGIYGLTAFSAGSINITLQTLAADGSTPVAVGRAISANGLISPIYLPVGLYRILVTSGTGIYVSISKIQVSIRRG